ncbi:hypothetical protein AB0I49_13330 [Streptomyces sp. NPDC050617]|uniref:hypothetical protein n=1 Tax=Streptomyces sp. NPDC050617 TaxID=3154628 RepID=UPI0034179C6C
MEAAQQTAARELGVLCRGPATWGWRGRSVGRRTRDGRWLRVACAPPGRTGPTEGVRTAAALLPPRVPRPRLYATCEWSADGQVYAGELTSYVEAPAISSGRIDLLSDPGLSDDWWRRLGQALRALASAESRRIMAGRGELAVLRGRGIEPPVAVRWVTGHGDLHWANLTRAPLTFLDWESWGLVPVGYDAGTLHALSLPVPEVAARVRREFAADLDSPAGRTGELLALTRLLTAASAGAHADLASLAARRLSALTGGG